MRLNQFWTEGRVEEAKNWPKGVSDYCKNHDISVQSFYDYCKRHSIPKNRTLPVDNRGNYKFTLQLFRECLKSTHPSKFCNDRNLSYYTFTRYKTFGFPSNLVSKEELTNLGYIKCEPEDNILIPTAKIADESNELSAEELDVFGSIVDDTVETDAVKPEIIENPVEPIGKTKKSTRRHVSKRRKLTKRRNINHFKWTEEMLKYVLTYPDGVLAWCEENNVTVETVRYACRKFGLNTHVLTEREDILTQLDPVSVDPVTETNVDSEVKEMIDNPTYVVDNDIMKIVPKTITITYKDGRTKEFTCDGKIAMVLPESSIDEIVIDGVGTITFL